MHDRVARSERWIAGLRRGRQLDDELGLLRLLLRAVLARRNSRRDRDVGVDSGTDACANTGERKGARDRDGQLLHFSSYRMERGVVINTGGDARVSRSASPAASNICPVFSTKTVGYLRPLRARRRRAGPNSPSAP